MSRPGIQINPDTGMPYQIGDRRSVADFQCQLVIESESHDRSTYDLITDVQAEVVMFSGPGRGPLVILTGAGVKQPGAGPVQVVSGMVDLTLIESGHRIGWQDGSDSGNHPEG